jgi:periplasmic copper chaperone A
MTRAAVPRAGRPVRELARAGLAPLVCAAVLIVLLSGWVLTGGAGTITRVRVEVTLADVPAQAFTAGAATGRTAPVYLVIRNLSGQPDELVSARSPAAARVALGHRGAAGLGTVAGFPVGAHGTLTLSPFGPDLVLIRPRALQAGQTVPLTLVFHHAGQVDVIATVTPPGSP